MSIDRIENQRLQYKKDILAALPAELQMINRLIENELFVQGIHRYIDKLDHTDLMVFDVNHSSSDLDKYFVYGFDVKQINNRGGQFPRGFAENRIIFETKDKNGGLGWGLFPYPQNRYIALVDGYGWGFDIDGLCSEYNSVNEFEANEIKLKEQVAKMFTRTPGQLLHRYYIFDLEGLQEFYYKHEEDENLMPIRRNQGEGSEYRLIPLSQYANDGHGYSYWEWKNNQWTRTYDGTRGQKSPTPGSKMIHFTGREIPKEEAPTMIQKVKEELRKQQEQYAIQQRAYKEKGYAEKAERIDYIRLKESARTDHEWAQSRIDKD